MCVCAREFARYHRQGGRLRCRPSCHAMLRYAARSLSMHTKTGAARASRSIASVRACVRRRSFKSLKVVFDDRTAAPAAASRAQRVHHDKTRIAMSPSPSTLGAGVCTHKHTHTRTHTCEVLLQGPHTHFHTHTNTRAFNARRVVFASQITCTRSAIIRAAWPFNPGPETARHGAVCVNTRILAGRALVRPTVRRPSCAPNPGDLETGQLNNNSKVREQQQQRAYTI